MTDELWVANPGQKYHLLGWERDGKEILRCHSTVARSSTGKFELRDPNPMVKDCCKNCQQISINDMKEEV